MSYEHHLCMSIILLNDISFGSASDLHYALWFVNCSRAHALTHFCWLTNFRGALSERETEEETQRHESATDC